MTTVETAVCMFVTLTHGVKMFLHRRIYSDTRELKCFCTDGSTLTHEI